MEEELFVDKHQDELIRRVTNIAPILDELLVRTVIDQESYDKIRAIHGSQKRMRVLLSGPLESSGVRGKQIFYKILKRNEPRLIDGLKRTESKTVMDFQVMDTVQVDTTTSKKLLIEILTVLSSKEFKKFKSLIALEKDFPLTSRRRQSVEDIVELMVETYSRKCVVVTIKVLKEMSRNDLVQRLSHISSSAKEKHMEHHPALNQKVETMTSVIEQLLETLADLSDGELKDLKHFLLSQRCIYKPYFEMLMVADMQNTVFFMAQTFGQQSVERIKDILIKMNKTDLVQRLSDRSPGPKKKHSVDEHLSAMIHNVATMTVVRELLLETLNDLSNQELNDFKWLLQFTDFKKGLQCIPWIQLELTGRAAILVDLMVETYGQQSVEVTREVFMEMKRSDLVQRLLENSSGPKEKHFLDEQQPALIQKVESMTSVIELLSETVADLSSRGLKRFKQVLLNHFTRQRFDIPWRMLKITNLQDTVLIIVQAYGQRSVEVTKKVFKDMKRPHLVQRLSGCSSGPKKKHNVEQLSTLIQKVATMVAVKEMLLETLNDLSYQELTKFKKVLQLTVFQNNLPDISLRLSDTENNTDIVDLMLQNYGQQSVELMKKIYKEMKRTDLVQRLSDTSSGPKEEQSVDEHWRAQKVESGVKQILLAILHDLNKKDLMKFKWLLQLTLFEKSLQQISWSHLECADQADIVDLMVKIGGQQSVEVTKEVLMDMNRTDLVERLSHTSKGPSRSLKFEAHGSITESSEWIKLEPEVDSGDADQAPTYSLNSDAGKFECGVSGLRWVCEEKVSFKYQFCSWEEHMERMESLRYMAAGPLLDITVITGKLYEVYLPHWICTDDNPKISDRFAVLHIDACGDVVERVSEVTPCHVKLPEPIFSPRAVLMKVGFSVKINCNVLIYYKPYTTFLKLHVYLIPHDPALQQAVDKKEFFNGYEIIQKSRPDKYLKMQHEFLLTADIDGAKILPEKLTLRYDSQDPNFYEVFIENPDRNFNLTLFYAYTNKSEQVCGSVWDCEIRKDDYPKSGHLEAEASSTGLCYGTTVSEVDELSALVQKAATITTVGERLLKMLQCLEEEDFKDFKWFLQKRNLIQADLPSIPWSKLEKADMKRVVDLMEQTYSQQAVEVTKMLFKKIKRNDLVKLL